MSEIINQLTNIQNISYEDARNTVGYIGMSVLPVVGVMTAVDYFRKPVVSHESVKGAEADILEEVVAEEKTGHFKNRMEKWGGPLLLAAGATTFAVNALDPQLEYEKAVPGVEFVTVIDESYSMQFTEDMSEGDQTRKNALNNIVNEEKSKLPNESNAEIILLGKNEKVVAPLSTDRPDLDELLNENTILQNGADAVSALELADNVLDGAGNSGGENLLFYTDGTVDNAGETIETIRTIAESGKNVSVVLTGTDTGEYTRSEFDVTPISSAVNTAEFAELADIENVTVIEAESTEDAVDVLREDVKKKSKTTEDRPVDLFTYGGIGLGVLGGIETARRKFKGRI